jgi:hypothetical protein
LSLPWKIAFPDGGSWPFGGGTAWLWSRPDAFECVDVLFVDEAAQMSLADVLAVSHAAKTVVLIGDPRQLEQPMQGSQALVETRFECWVSATESQASHAALTIRVASR